jgi:hypothetical protein
MDWVCEGWCHACPLPDAQHDYSPGLLVERDADASRTLESNMLCRPMTDSYRRIRRERSCGLRLQHDDYVENGGLNSLMP